MRRRQRACGAARHRVPRPPPRAPPGPRRLPASGEAGHCADARPAPSARAWAPGRGRPSAVTPRAPRPGAAAQAPADAKSAESDYAERVKRAAAGARAAPGAAAAGAAGAVSARPAEQALSYQRRARTLAETPATFCSAPRGASSRGLHAGMRRRPAAE
jgi:hypothetical protein